jgi:hypothetical protein
MRGSSAALIAISTCALVAACGGTPPRPTLGGSRLLSLSYGDFQPRGAPVPYPGLKLTVVEAGGQILAINFDAYSGTGVTADSGCGLAGRRGGRLETFYTPFNLRAGPQTVRITAVASACRSRGGTRSSTRTFHIYVRRTDAPSREPLGLPLP